MAVTVRQLIDGGLKWAMFEQGLQVWWNRLNQVFSAEIGSTVVAGTTVIGTLDVADGAGGGIQKTPLRPIAGPFAATGAEITTSGYKVPPADPGGAVGPHPRRQSQQFPPDGNFRATR